MRHIKIVVWGLVIAFCMLVFFQNKAFLTATQGMQLDLFFVDPVESPALYNGVWLLAALFLGLLIAYFFSLGERFRSRRTIKAMQSRLSAQEERIATFERGLQAPAVDVPSADPSDASAAADGEASSAADQHPEECA